MPRWFGLSLVIVHLAAIAVVGHLAFGYGQVQSAGLYRQTATQAVELLGSRLETLVRAEEGTLDATRLESLMQRELRSFSAGTELNSLRVIDSAGKVIASQQAAEIGAPARYVEQQEKEGEGQFLEIELNLPAVAAAPAGDDDGSAAGAPAAVYVLEARLESGQANSAAILRYTWPMAAVIVTYGILFLLYRALRSQMRGVSLIAQRLRTTVGNLEGDFASLQIADAVDTTVNAWNELVSLMDGLRTEVERSKANGELSRAFQHVHSGALATALNAVPDAIMYIVDGGRFEYLNATACRMMGWNEEERASATLATSEATPIGTEVLGVLREARLSDSTFDSATRLLEVEGTETAYRVWVTPLPGTRHQGECVAVVRDVSQQIKADRAREEFVTHVSHELRTPLTNIRAYAETLSSGMFDDPKVITECYNVITKETRRLSRLVEDVLSVSQMEVGSIELVLDRINLRELLTDGVRDVRGLADEKNIDLQLVLPTKVDAVEGDRDKLAVVVNNILGNAIKYTPDGGAVIIGVRASEQVVELTFKDNGIGIDPKNHGLVFERFKRVSEPEVEAQTGTGVGLYTAREIVRRHGGDIDLVSHKGEGSTFIVRLPRAESRSGQPAMAQEA